MKVRNNGTQEVGRVIGFWLNCAGNVVVNVKVGGMSASWLAGIVTVL